MTSTFLTLLVLPALYRIFTGWDPSGIPSPVAQKWEEPDKGPLKVEPESRHSDARASLEQPMQDDASGDSKSTQ